MTTLDLTQHPELLPLVEAIRLGDAVEIVDRGRPVARCVPSPSTLRERLEALQRSFASPAYPGNSVVDMRHESR